MGIVGIKLAVAHPGIVSAISARERDILPEHAEVQARKIFHNQTRASHKQETIKSQNKGRLDNLETLTVQKKMS